MPRTKGSKNRSQITHTDYASQIAQKQETIAFLNIEIASITANIDTLKADLKEKKTALKKAKVEAVLKKLLASDVSAEEILEKLK